MVAPFSKGALFNLVLVILGQAARQRRIIVILRSFGAVLRFRMLMPGLAQRRKEQVNQQVRREKKGIRPQIRSKGGNED